MTVRYPGDAPSGKQNAFAGCAPPERASECLVRLRLYLWWAWGYTSPRFQLNTTSGSLPLPRSSHYTRDNPKGRLVASIFTSVGTPMSSPNYGSLKGAKWGRREEGTWGALDRQRGSIPASPAEALSTYSARVSRGWRNPRWLSRGGIQAPRKISTTNPLVRLLVVTHTAVDRAW